VLSSEGFSIPWSFGGLTPEEARADTSRVVVVPVPYDSTTSFRSGSREGPNSIINASRYLEDYDIELARETYRVGIHTTNEIEPHVGGPEHMIDRVHDFVYPWIEDGKLITLLGGEHSISVGAVRALSKFYPDLSVLYFDAHADMRNEYMGSKFSHACTARRIMEICPIVPVGIRSMSKEEMDFIQNEDIRIHFGGELNPNNEWNIEDIVGSLSEHVYVSVDLDVLNLGIMSAVGTPEPGGISWNTILSIIREVCSRRNLVGFDLTELTPGDGPIANSFVAAKLAYKMIGYAT
jgi:agmatinase